MTGLGQDHGDCLALVSEPQAQTSLLSRCVAPPASAAAMAAIL